MDKKSIPGNVDAERAVLGSAIMDDTAASLVVASLTEESFSGKDMRNILVFRALKNLSERKTVIETTSIIDELINTKTLNDAGGTEYIFKLVDGVIDPDNVDHYITIVQNQAVLRDFLNCTAEIGEQYQNGEVTDIGDFISSATQKLEGIAARRSVGGFQDASVLSEAVRIKIENESNFANRGITGVDTGYRRLNLYTHGWQKGDLIILAARPSVGKTAFALNLALKATKSTGKPVAFFSGEMSSEQVMKRLLSATAMVNSESIQTGQLNARDKQKIASGIEELKKTKLYFDDTPNPALGDIVVKARKLKAAHPDLCLILIDYLNIIRTESKIENRSLEIALITSTLKEMARTLHVPVICLSQLNRNADESGTPMLSNLKESGAIEQDADIVMLMYRKDYYTSLGQKSGARGFANSDFSKKLEEDLKNSKANNEDKGSVSVVDIAVAKNRNGRTGVIVLLFQKSYSRFDNPALEMEQQIAAAEGRVLEVEDE